MGGEEDTGGQDVVSISVGSFSVERGGSLFREGGRVGSLDRTPFPYPRKERLASWRVILQKGGGGTGGNMWSVWRD